MKDLKILAPGQRLRKVRRDLGLRQEDLAGKSISKNYISMFENGKRRISIINATYFADILNHIAEEKGIDLNIAASYFIKSEKDIAREKCIDWLDKISNNKEIGKTELYKKLYKIMYLSYEHAIDDIFAKTLEIKGNYLYRTGLYTCAIAHYSTCLLYYSKLENNEALNNIYLAMGNTYFMVENYSMAITYYNLVKLDNEKEDILYYKGLSYYKLGQYGIAQGILQRIMFKDERVLELESSINNIG